MPMFLKIRQGHLINLWSNKMNIVTPKEVYELAREKGWWDTYREVPELLCLIHSEVSEALEAYRNRVPEGTKGCFSEELADVVIRIWDMSFKFGIDIVEAVNKKHEFNKTRPYRHGKVC